MKERNILGSVINSRDAYEQVKHFVGREDLSEQGWFIWAGVVDYYDADAEASRVDSGILSENTARKVAVASLSEFDGSIPNIVADLLDHKREVVGHRLAAAILSGDTPNGLLTEYGELLDATQLDEDTDAEDDRQGYDVESLVGNSFDSTGLIHVAPSSLNARLDGGVRPGHHLVLFARPEMGKTMMVIEMMAGFAAQNLTCLYIGNEDPITDINMRVVNRLSGMTKLEVLNKPKEADTKARENGYENIILHSACPGTPRGIQKLLEKYKPDVLVLDQLRNINTGNDNYVLKLEEAATHARNWAKKYSCVVVSVTQAGDSAANKAALDLGDVDYSNTGIPGQADVMIGLGANHNHKAAGELVISLPKNKISAVHEAFAVTTEPQLSKILAI
jgi:KaiC/GvpD/RAD55 family RecA-like ATPase